jgi:hypothetical protein
MEFYKKILSNKLYQGSQLSNFQLNTFIDQDNRPLPLGEQDVAISEYQQFINERNNSTCYRLSGILRGLFTNILFNVTGDRSYENILALTGDTGEFNPNVQIFQNFGYKDILLERDGWFFYREKTAGTLKGCVNNCLRPLPNDFYFLPLAYSGKTMLDPNGDPVQNWYFKLTYPAYSGTCSNIYFQSPYVAGSLGQVNLCDGIVINNIFTGIINGRNATYVQTPINHGLLDGDQVIIRPFDIFTTEKIFNVLAVSGETGFWIDYYDNFVPITFINASTINFDPLRFKRIFQGIESQYMPRVFKSISNLNDYQIYQPTSFGVNMFHDPLELYHFNTDIDTSPYKDYLNRPLTELYLTKIKYTNPGKIIADMEDWTILTVGLLTNQPNQNYDVRAIYGGSPNRLSPPPPKIINFVTENDTEFFGDIVDYNIGDITERIIAVPYYRFNSVNREDNAYGEGYFYKAHDKIQLLEFSSQVEQENLILPDANVPDYVVTVNGVQQWRDLLTPGFKDAAGRGVDYPFLNGCTYIFTEHDMCLYRQNPKQLEVYSGTVATYANNVVNPVNLNFNNTINTSYNVSAPSGQNTSGSLIIANSNYVAQFYGIYVFNYNLTIGMNPSTLPIGNEVSTTLIIEIKNNLGVTKETFTIGNISSQNLSTLGSMNFTGSLNIILDVNDYVNIVTLYDGKSYFGANNLNVTFSVIGSFGSSFQITTNNIPNGTVSQLHYWIAGVNCDRIYGEYIEPVDGDC